MAKRDFQLFLTLSCLVFALFAPLVLRPGLIPGNFGDLYSYHYPLRHLVTATLQEGRLPLWNPYTFAGTPLAANSQSVLWYPFSLIHYFLPLAWSFSLDAFLHVLLAAFGAHLLLRKSGLDAGGAAILSAAYALSPFLVYRIPQGIPTHLNALAWAPWVWLAALASNPLWLAMTWTLQVFSGHPQFSLLNGVALALFIAIRRPRALSRVTVAGGIAVLLAARQVLPTLEYLRHSVRSIWDLSLTGGYSLSPTFLLTYIYPNAFGNPHQESFVLFPSEFFEMLTGYLGLVPLALALIGLLRFKASWLLVGVGLFLAMGHNNAAYIALQRFGGLDFLRTPARFSFLILIGVWLAAGRGWKWLRPRVPATVVAVLLVATGVDLAWWAHSWLTPDDPKNYLSSNPAAVDVLRKGGGRFATDPDNLTPNKSMQYRLFNVTGYDAYYPAPIAVYTHKSERAPAADGSRTYVRNWKTPEMSKLGVARYVTTRNVVDENPIFHEGATYIYANENALPLVQGAGAFTWLRPEHLTMRLDSPGSPLVSQTAYPGWKAWLDGRSTEIDVEDGIFPRIRGPQSTQGGPWKIHFRFDPVSWFAGVFLSIVATSCAGLYGYGWLIGRNT